MGHRAFQTFAVVIVVIGVLNLVFRVSERAGWFDILGAAGQLLLFSLMLASTVYARRQNRPGSPR
jgi:hypothetical protein